MSRPILKITYPPKDICIDIDRPEDEELVDLLNSIVKANLEYGNTIECESMSEVSTLLEQINRVYDAYYDKKGSGPFQISLA